ncbi:hypothetical protein EB796_017764 [Bugula neritina]|uniref:Uncharacterized protein n=1 Tax=Bugula neritina TaxID=10212 RepID=A0A7J7JEX5_BUGNE|nr:hypothetical protein EB796_017764 [Bugula neritina]
MLCFGIRRCFHLHLPSLSCLRLTRTSMLCFGIRRCFHLHLPSLSCLRLTRTSMLCFGIRRCFHLHLRSLSCLKLTRTVGSTSTSIAVTIPKATSQIRSPLYFRSRNPINRTSVTATVSSLLKRTYCPDFLFDVHYCPSFI